MPVLNLPVKIPMIYPPKKYLDSNSSKKLGGFLLNDILYIEPLIIDNPLLAEKTQLTKDNLVYKMIDNISSVKFQINQEVLDFINKYYNKYDLIIDPDFKHPLESKAKLTLSERKELESFKSKKNLENEILNLAQIFRNCSEIYIPVKIDYRGRLYCNVEYLNYQGVELAKALLRFSEGEIVKLDNKTAINYLKIFGANCYGNSLDKKSFVARIEWINNNIEDIINLENGNLLSKAENKLLFIAFCFEFKKYFYSLKNNHTYFITNLPIQLDATCNGFQHLSLLLEDMTLAKKVNLTTSTWKDTPADFYTIMAFRVKDYFNLKLAEKDLDVKDRESYLRLSNTNIQNHRSLLKKTIMTIPYNASKFANILDIKEEFNFVKLNNEDVYVYKKNDQIIFKHIDFVNIVKALYKCLYSDFPRLEELLKYFREIAKISNVLGISIPWTLPSGLVVQQKYFGKKKIKLKPFIYSKDLLNINVIDKKTLNPRKQINSLMPNLVHSLDAASLALLIDSFFKEGNNNNFYSIHDCFAVTCNNVSLIYDLLKLSYSKIYSSSNFLQEFDDNFKEIILKQIGVHNYSEETNEIIISNIEGDKLKIKYPDINKVFNPSNLDYNKNLLNKIQFDQSSYLVK